MERPADQRCYPELNDLPINGVLSGVERPADQRCMKMEDIRPHTTSELLEGAQYLGVTTHEQEKDIIPKSLNYYHVCTTTFSNLLTYINPPIIPYEGLDRLIKTVKESEGLIMYTDKKCKKAQKRQPIGDNVIIVIIRGQ